MTKLRTENAHAGNTVLASLMHKLYLQEDGLRKKCRYWKEKSV
jgi:hypothetical protein